MLSTLLLFAIPHDAAAIESVVKAEMERQGIPGISVLVKRGDDVVLRSAYGVANVELEVPARPENVYNAGSITKTFTALTVMSLVEEGKLSLDENVSKHVSRAPETWSEITVKNLLSHTSGIPEYALIPGLGLIEEYTRDFWWEKIGPLPLDFKTGTRFAYSNSNFTVLSEIIEKVSGKSYYDSVRERVIDKIGLKDTKFRQTNEIVPRLATGYFKTGEGMIVSPSEASSSAYGAGGIVTCVDDLAAFLAAVGAGRVVSRETLRQMQTANRTADGRKTIYGLGWFVRDLSGHPMVSHAGNTAGYSASMAYFPDEDLTVCVMGNVYAFSGDNLAIAIARAIEPELRPLKLAPKTDPEPALTKTLFSAFSGLTEGKTDSEVLDADYRAQFETGRGRMSLGGFAQYKDYEGPQFLDRKPEEPDTLYSYRIKKGDRSFRVVFTVTKDRKVFAVSVQREEG
jgi:serine beta-lactamase-like protein LACTB